MTIPTMIVLRAVRPDMNVDLEVETEVPNVERGPNGNVVVYGTETDGALYYVVLSKELVDLIKSV